MSSNVVVHTVQASEVYFPVIIHFGVVYVGYQQWGLDCFVTKAMPSWLLLEIGFSIINSRIAVESTDISTKKITGRIQ